VNFVIVHVSFPSTDSPRLEYSPFRSNTTTVARNLRG